MPYPERSYLQCCMVLQPKSHWLKPQLMTWQQDYFTPLLQFLEQTPHFRIALSIHGHLLDFLGAHGESDLLRLKPLVERNQVEVLGGLFYGAIPALLAEVDVRGQIEMTREFWLSFLAQSPRGLFLGDLAVAAELPRLLSDTDLHYGFVSQNQVASEPGERLTAGWLQRGSNQLLMYVLHPQLSATLLKRDPAEWLQAAIDQSHTTHYPLTTVWMRPEATLPAAPCLAYLQQLAAQCQANQQHLGLTLPHEQMEAVTHTGWVVLKAPCAPELHPLIDASKGNIDWMYYSMAHPEIGQLFSKMQRTSKKLFEMIGIMEDEEIEPQWSSALANAQRLLFKAQAGEAYWYQEAQPDGLASLQMREQSRRCLLQADNLMDELQSNDNPQWLHLEDQTLTQGGEIWLANQHLGFCLAPGQGCGIRSCDHRGSLRNVLSASSDGHGMHTLLFGADSALKDYYSQKSPLPLAMHWQWQEHGFDELGDGQFHLSGTGRSKNAAAAVEVMVHIAIDLPATQLVYQVQVQGHPHTKGYVAVSMPWRCADYSWLQLDHHQPCPLHTTVQHCQSAQLYHQQQPLCSLQFLQPCEVVCDPWIPHAETGTHEAMAWRLLAYVPLQEQAKLQIQVNLHK